MTDLTPPKHPLDPLNADEIIATVTLLRQAELVHQKVRIITISAVEPHKDVLHTWTAEQDIDRQVLIVLLDNNDGKTYEVLLSLSSNQILSREHKANVQPAIVIDEFIECEQAMKNDPRFRQAMHKRGISDFDLLMVDPWSAGCYGADERESTQRLARTIIWQRQTSAGNGYAHPVEGVLAWVDLNTMELVHLEDNGIVPIPQQNGEYAAVHHQHQFRTSPKPLEIIQPEGPSFEVNGHHVEWLGWSFRIGFSAREGLVLHQISYRDADRLRSIVHRASVSEMVVPYGDPHVNYYRRNAFDVGEYGIGLLANSLALGCDCLGHIRYFDAHIATSRGEVVEIKNAICMHEEDYGILWKHFDWRTEQTEVRRSRRLVISFIATVGNYEYGFFWYLYLDGTIEFEVKLTGIVNTGALASEQKRQYGTLLAPGLYAPIHQHIFNIRLDMAVDGLNNSVYEVNTKAEAIGPDNPHGNAFYAEFTLLKSEQQAARCLNQQSARYWKVVNPNKLNALGEPVAYKLMPGDNAFAFSNPESSVRKRAGFMNHHFWVTAYDPAHYFAAGEYPNQSDPQTAPGLPSYIAQDRLLENRSLTVWYTMNSHHIVRPEDWPVMPVSYIGFHLKPFGFFDRNPAIHLAPTSSTASRDLTASRGE